MIPAAKIGVDYLTVSIFMNSKACTHTHLQIVCAGHCLLLIMNLESRDFW